MEEHYWLNCPCAETEWCPQPEAVARAYLIPQLLDPSEFAVTIESCRTCGKYLDEKRRYPRLKRPFQIILRKATDKTIEGEIINISETGALVRMHNWSDFYKDESLTLEIYKTPAEPEEGLTDKIEIKGQITRIENKKQQLAIVFLKETE